MKIENWLGWREDLTERDIRDWIDWNIEFPPDYRYNDYEAMGFKMEKEVKFDIDLYYITHPSGRKYYIDSVAI